MFKVSFIHTPVANRADFKESSLLPDSSEPIADQNQFRRLTGNSFRDLMPLEFSKAAQMAFFLWQRNPLARRMIQILKDFCVGDELQVEVTIKKRSARPGVPDANTERTEGQDAWREFKDDPVNNWDNDISRLIESLLVNGELPLPAEVNDLNGHVRFGYIDPRLIKEVVMLPTNARQPDKILFTPHNSTETITKKVIRQDIDPKSPTFERLTGEVFYFRTNYLIGQTRGHSELIELLDWLDGLDQFLFNSMEGNALRNAFVWDVTLSGADQTTVDNFVAYPPRSGSVKVHNDKVVWDVLTPDLKASDQSEATRLYKNFILAGKGYPEYWFADGGQTNLATAEVMTVPTMRMLQAKQKEVRDIIKFIVQFVLDQAIIKKSLTMSKDEYFDIQVNAFDFERKDAAEVAQAFVSAITGLVTAVQSNLVRKDDAVKVIAGYLQRMGYETDETLTAEQIAQQNGEIEANDLYSGKFPPDGDRADDGTEPDPGGRKRPANPPRR